MIVLENTGLVKHFRDGRFNVYLTVEDYENYLKEHPEDRIKPKGR